MLYQYDLFISYATGNADIANYIVERLEEKGHRCFIAPRDIRSGAEYAGEIIRGISNSAAMLLIFSSNADKSPYVLREVNSAVSRNTTIIPLRIEDFLPSEAMEFYLGPTHWLDAFPQVLDVHLDKIISIFSGINAKQKEIEQQNTEEAPREYAIVGPELLQESQIHRIGMTYPQLTMKALEIDYLCISPDKYIINEETEGTFDDWKDVTVDYGNDVSILLVEKDEIIGYVDAFPVTEEAYEELIAGRALIRGNMIELFSMGGEFSLFVSMMALIPGHITQDNYMMLFGWLFEHIAQWKAKDICITRIGFTTYSDLLEKFLVRFGFTFRCLNPSKGKVYEISIEDLRSKLSANPRYAALVL